MELIAQVALEITQRVLAIVCGRAGISCEIGNASRTRADRFEQLRPMFDVCELGKNVGQPRFRVA